MVKKLILMLVCIISICSIENAYISNIVYHLYYSSK